MDAAAIAKLTLNEAMALRDQGRLTPDEYRAFLYVWHADPTKTVHAPMKHRPMGSPDGLIDDLLRHTGIDEFAKLDAWSEQDRKDLVAQQQAILRMHERR